MSLDYPDMGSPVMDGAHVANIVSGTSDCGCRRMACEIKSSRRLVLKTNASFMPEL